MDRAVTAPGPAGEALALAGITDDGLAREQRALAPDVARFHRAILREFVERGGPPPAQWLRAEASRLGVDTEAALGALVARDLIVREPQSDSVASAYPFAGTPTRHRVEVEGGRPVYAMCAVDALGIPFMLGRDVIITSADPTTGAPIRVEVREGQARWEPATAVAFVGTTGEQGSPKAQSCCAFVNFFATPESAAAYRRAHLDLKGRVLSQADALAAGKQVFGRLLAQDEEAPPERSKPRCAC